MTDTIEPPVQTETGPSANDVFHSESSFERPGTESPPSQQQPEQKKAPETAKPEAKPYADKPEAAPDGKKDDKGKSKLDKLSGVKKPEEKKEEEATPGAEQPPEKPVDTANMRQLREAYNKSKEDAAALRAELEKIRPDFEKVADLRKELDGSREELAKLKAMNLNDEERTSYTKLRELHALSELRESAKFQTEFVQPIQGQGRRLEAVAKGANLSPAAFEALKNAMDITSELDRKREIRRILKEAPELPPEDFTDYYTEAVSVGDKLNNDIYPKMEAAEKHALEIEQAARTKGKQEAEQKAVSEKETFQKERDYVKGLLKDEKLKLLFEDTNLSIDGVTLSEAMDQVEPADNPRDRAYEVQAGAALPFIIEWSNGLLAKIHELENANRVRNGSAPKRGDSVEKPTNGQDQQADINKVFKGFGSFGGP